MAKRETAATEAKIRRNLKAGRGQGMGASYVPWLLIQDFSSLGRVTRTPGATTGRVHHFMSDLERALGLTCDWDPSISDMREQFPLDRAETLAIAQDIGVRHPCPNGVHIVMTTDLLIDYDRGAGPERAAISVKYASDLESETKGPRIFEKAEIERRYWRSRGVRFVIMTEREISKKRAKVLKWLAEWRTFEGLAPPQAGTWTERAALVEDGLRRAGDDGSVLAFCRRLEGECGLAPGDALSMIRHLAANKRILLDVDRGLDLRRPLTQISFPAAGRIAKEAA